MNLFAHGREVHVARICIRRKDGDAHAARFVNILYDFFRVSGFRSQQRGHKFHGIVRLEPGGLISQERIGAGVGFVESVAGKLGHEIENAFGLFRRNFMGGAAGEEFLALRGHLVAILFAHGAAQDIGFAEGKSGQAIGDLHDLLLIKNDAVGFFQDFLQFRQIVGDFFLAVLAGDEIVDHAALDGAGAIERVERGQVFEARGLITAQDVAHAAGLKLEDGGGIGACKKLIGGGIVERKRMEIDLHGAIGGDELHGIGENRERGQAEEIHLQQAEALESLHVVLRGDFFAIGFVERQQFGERLRRDDHAGGVRGGVSREAFQALGYFEKIPEALVAFDGGAKLAGLLEGFVERDVELVGNELGQTIHVAIRQIHGAAHVFERGFGGHGAEGDDLRDVVAAVFLGDVIDHFAAPPHAKINVDIGHGNAFGIEKALEEQIVLQRIDVGNFQRVTHQAARGRSASGADGNPLRARIAHEVPDDQEVAGVAHLHDHLDFILQALFVFRERAPQPALLGERFEIRQARGESFARDALEITIHRVALRHLEFGEGIAHRLDAHVAAFGDGRGAFERVRQFAEDLGHLLGGLEIKLIGGKAHALGIRHGLAGLNAEQHFLRAGVGAREVMAIVGGHQGNAALAREAHELAIHGPIDLQALVLNFEEEIAFAEDVAQAIGGVAGIVVTALDERLGHRAAQAGGKRNEPAAVLGQQVVIDARLIVEAFEETGRN